MAALRCFLPAPAAGTDPVAYALRWLPLAALLLAATIVGDRQRPRDGPGDPTRPPANEDQAMRVNIRVADNTLQQFALFAAGALGLAASLDGPEVRIVGAAAIVFVIARIAFWIGYRIHPLYRAAGFSSTAYLNFGQIDRGALWFAARRLTRSAAEAFLADLEAGSDRQGAGSGTWRSIGPGRNPSGRPHCRPPAWPTACRSSRKNAVLARVSRSAARLDFSTAAGGGGEPRKLEDHRRAVVHFGQ